MSQISKQNKTIPSRRKPAAIAAKAPPQTVRMQFPGSDKEYVCAFVDGPSDIGMIAILNHDAAELGRIVAGLAAFRAQAAARAAARKPPGCLSWPALLLRRRRPSALLP